MASGWQNTHAQFFICSVTGDDQNGNGSQSSPWRTLARTGHLHYTHEIAIRGVFFNDTLGGGAGRVFGENIAIIINTSDHDFLNGAVPNSTFHFFNVHIQGGYTDWGLNIYEGCVLQGVTFSRCSLWSRTGYPGVRILDSSLTIYSGWIRKFQISNSFLYNLQLGVNFFFEQCESYDSFFHIISWDTSENYWKDHAFDKTRDTFRVGNNPSEANLDQARVLLSHAFGQSEDFYFQDALENTWSTEVGGGEVDGGTFEKTSGFTNSPFYERYLGGKDFIGVRRNMFAPKVISRFTDKNYFDSSENLETYVPQASSYAFKTAAFVKLSSGQTSEIRTPAMCFDKTREVGVIGSMFQVSEMFNHFLSLEPMWKSVATDALPLLTQNTWYLVISGQADYNGRTYIRNQKFYYTTGTIEGQWEIGLLFEDNVQQNYGVWHSLGNVKKSPGASLRLGYFYVSENEYQSNPTKATPFLVDVPQTWQGPGDVIELWKDGEDSPDFHVFPLNEKPMVNTDTGDETGVITSTNFDDSFDSNSAIPLFAAAIRVISRIHNL